MEHSSRHRGQRRHHGDRERLTLAPTTVARLDTETHWARLDTRYGIGGYLAAGEIRHFHSYGDVRDQNQAAGGVPPSLDYPESCPFALGEHEAVHVNVTVVSLAGGFGTLWPWNEARPAASFINYGAGAVVANAGVIKTTAATGADPDFSVYAHGNSHFIIDVLGYFSP